MGSVVCLLAAMLPAAPNDPPGQLPVRLSRGQEFVYRGVYKEEINRPANHSSRSIAVETHILVLNQSADAADVAVMTVRRPLPIRDEVASEAQLEIAKVDSFGRMEFRPARRPLRGIPVDGPPNLETAAFVERPRGGLIPGKSWDRTELSDPPTSWSIAGIEFMPGGNCLKLVGQQQSESWGRPGRSAWRRKDVVWLALDNGVAVKFERETQVCNEGGEIVHGSQLVALLESFRPTELPPSEFDARRLEIQQSTAFARRLDDLFGAPAQGGFDTLIAQTNTHLHNREPTPYRDSVLTIKRRAESARNGERPPEPLIVQTRKESFTCREGQPAPDLILADAISGEAVRLDGLRGQVVLLLLFKPHGRMSSYVLRYAEWAGAQYAGKVCVLALAADGTPGELVELRLHLRLKRPVYDGREAAKRFAGETTPCAVMIDATGTIRRIVLGWGGEYPDWFATELEKLVQP
jgi:hypothetical protein